MNTSQIKSIVTRALLPVLVLAPALAGAQFQPTRDTNPIGAIPTGSGVFQSTNLIQTVSIVIRWALGFIGIVIFIIFLLAGFEYATAGGDEGRAKTATARMINAVIGLIIIFFAFVASNAILGFVFPQNF
jgi:hypothetical protein